MDKPNTLEICIDFKVEQYIAHIGDENFGHLYKLCMESVEKPLLSAVLKHTNNNKTQAAKVLGINRNTLKTKMKIHQL